jgi:hypothetical protein
LPISAPLSKSTKNNSSSIPFERSAGAAAVVPAGAVQAFRNIGETPTEIHFELLPAGDSEEAFALMVRGEIGDVDAFFDKYGMDLAGPPLRPFGMFIL